MDLLLAWLIYPVALALVCGGLGLLVERLAGARLPGVLIVPLGLAALTVVASLTTAWTVTAPATTALVVLLALAGAGAGVGRLRGARPDVPAVLLACAVFAVFAAPVALAGEPTFAGYGVLGDTAIQLIGIDRLLEHGRSTAGLAPSSYQAALQGYFDSGYPFGAQVAIGSVRPLTGLDAAWIYQPGLAVLVVGMALSLYALIGRLVRSAWQRAGVAFVAAQPALVYAYALQGSVKELGTASVVALLAALVAPFARAVAREPGSLRATVPLAVAAAASVAVVGLAAAPWLGPVLLAALVLAVRSRPPRAALARQAGLFALLVLALSTPALAQLDGYFRVTAGVVTAGEEVGNLIGPLNPLQVVGVWINGDYRLDPGGSWRALTWMLVALALAAAVAGAAWALRRRSWEVLLYVGTSLLACAVVVSAGSPWADAKAFTIVSPAVLLAAMLGAVALASADAARMRRGALAGGALAAAIAGGVLLSNAFAYRDVALAPHDRLAELERLGEEDLHGPLLTTEFEEYAKHFLRAADPSGVSEAYSPRPIDPRPEGGAGPRFGFPSDLDALAPPYVHAYRTIVMRRSPIASRPPAGWERRTAGRWYEVWERDPGAAAPLAHLSLGSDRSPAAVPRCADVRTLARQARAAGAALAYVERPQPAVFLPTEAPERPVGWGADGAEPLLLRTNGEGAIAGTIHVERAGRYALWLAGSFGGALRVELDGRRAGGVERELNGRGQFAPLGTVSLAAGDHAVRIVREPRSLTPGGAASRIGPLMLVPAGADAAAPTVRTVAPGEWHALCGRSLDWIEVLPH